MTSKNDHSVKSNQQVAPVDEQGGHPDSLDRLSLAFETSARRWELIVYPSLFAFILLAAYGFYLVFSLAKDVHFLAKSVDANMSQISSNIMTMSDSVGQLSANVRTMAVSVDSMARDVRTLEPMLTNMDSMEESMKAMTVSTHFMHRDMRVMNHSIYDASRPMAKWNSIMPW
jgi:outer membrane murein-binding lipoprotein Lpp